MMNSKEEVSKEILTYFEKYPKISLVLGINNKKEFIEADNVFQALIKAREFTLEETFKSSLTGWFIDERSGLHCSFCQFVSGGKHLNNHSLFKRILCDDCLSKWVIMQEELKKELSGGNE